MHLNPITFCKNIVERSMSVMLSDIGLALKIVDRLRKVLHAGNFFQRAELTYFRRVKWLAAFHDRQHPAHVPEEEINAFLIHLQ